MRRVACAFTSEGGAGLGERRTRSARRGRGHRLTSLPGSALSGLLDLLLDGLQVEARALLHGRELDRRPGQLPDLLLHVDEAPELVLEPLEVLDRAGESRALEGVEPQVHQDWDVRLD